MASIQTMAIGACSLVMNTGCWMLDDGCRFFSLDLPVLWFHSSKIRWPFIPPKPKALTAARRGRSTFLFIHSSADVCTRKGLFKIGLFSGAFLKLSDGGRILCLKDKRVFIIPAEPAPVKR